MTFRLPLQSLTDIHLHSDYDGELEANGSMQRLYFLALLAVFILLLACVNFMNLATARAAQRAQEIGVRKVLGASVGDVVGLLARDFARPVVAALVVAAPLAWLAMNRWLDGFAYRIELGLGVFLLAGGLALLVALLTVSAQALRAAAADPVQSLRYE